MNKGVVYTSYFSKADKIEDSYKVAIARWLPSFVITEKKIYDTKEPKHYVHIPEFAPDEDILTAHKKGGITFDELLLSMHTRLDIGMKQQSKIKFLVDNFCKLLDQGNNIAFVCYEKDLESCHRKVIGDLFKKIGYNVIEF